MNFTPHDIEKKSFLVVDDFGDMRSMMKSMLVSIGTTDIDTAANGRDAIEALEKRRYDLILCDFNLGPGKNGQQVLEEARFRNLIGLNTLFVMVTAENTREMVMGAVEYEPNAYLTKPFTKELLRSRLEKLVERHRDLQPVERAVEARNFRKAIRLLDCKIAGSPTNIADLTKLKADLCCRAGDFGQASEIYEKALAVREMPWARLGLGRVMYATGRLQEASEQFESLLRDNQQFTAAYDWLARTLTALGRPDEAQQTLQRAVELSPKAILRQKALGEIALRNDDAPTAERAFSQAVKLGRHSVYREPLLYANLARAKARNGCEQEGLKTLTAMEKEFRGAADSPLYSAMTEGEIQGALGNEERAAHCLARANELYQGLGSEIPAQLTLAMARVCGNLGDQERAKELLGHVVRNNHAEHLLLTEVGALATELALDMDPERFISDIRKEIIKLNNRGVELAKAGHLEDAVGLFGEAVAAMPGNKVVNLNTARILIMYMREKGIDREQLGKVHQFLDRVQRSDPESPDLRRVRGMYQELLKQSA